MSDPRKLHAVFPTLVLLIGLAGGSTGLADSTTNIENVAAMIDGHISEALRRDEITPAPLADDAEFLRRVYLDLAGTIPPVAEVRRFLNDSDPQKRSKVVNDLLNSPRYVVHFTNVWRALLLPEAANDPRLRFQVEGFEAWLRTQLFEEVGYDQIVQRLITTQLTSANMSMRRQSNTAEPTAIAFFIAKEGKPENLTAGISRQFLGIRIECAECHDHPFADWKRDEFWSLAAFFSGVQSDNQFTVSETASPGKLAIPGTAREVAAAFLDGSTPQAATIPGREALAKWITAPDNPFFARAAVNRLWAHFFGIGIVVPVDDMEIDNPPSHPELLAELSRVFVDRDFDLKFLIRAITTSQAYQRSSKLTHESQDDPRYFARMVVRGLSPEQIYDSLSRATGNRNEQGKAEFVERFTSEPGMPIDVQTTILQALAMMNGPLVAAATDLEQSATMTAAAEFPLFDDRQRIEALFLAALSRFPREEELSRFLSYVQQGGATGDKKAALADVFWVLLNSSEFLFNH